MPSENKLIILGGPSCAGKSTLVRKIQKGRCPVLCEQLGVRDPSSWRYYSAKDLKRSGESFDGCMLVHYDTYGLFWEKNQTFYHLDAFLKKANSVTVLTLGVRPKNLVKRNNERIVSFLSSLLKRETYRGASFKQLWDRKNRLFKKRSRYQNSYSLFLYEKWFDFFNQQLIECHWVLDANDSKVENSELIELGTKNSILNVSRIINS